MSTRREPLEGQSMRYFYVLEYVGHSMYKCLCKQCGVNTREVSSRYLRNGMTKGCKTCFPPRAPGNKPRLDLIGQTFGRLKVLRYLKHGIYLARCKCGSTREVRITELTSGRITRCVNCARLGMTVPEKDLPVAG